ncbi:MAG: quercetin dioxygenase-like cupin family protein, partial [Kiritimatiellia bacterium]
PDVQDLLNRCLAVSERVGLRLSDLMLALSGDIDGAEIDAMCIADPEHAYGRHVLLDGEFSEIMIASWTRGVRCAPHDHGGSVGAVRVLRGEGLHRVWTIKNGLIQLVLEEVVRPGDIVSCGPDMVHSLGDNGAQDKLATLHMYAGPIAAQTVYDVAANRTLVVGGGAWVPGPEDIKAQCPGLVLRGAIA